MNALKQRNTLFLLSSLNIGGSERKSVRLANSLASQGMSVVVAYLGGPDTLADDLDPSIPCVNLQRRGKFSVGACVRLASLTRKHAISTILAINLYAALYAVLLKILRPFAGLRVIAAINTTSFLDDHEERQMALYKRVLRHAELLIYGAAAQRRQWTTSYGLIDSDARSVVIHNGVDADYFHSANVSPRDIPGWTSPPLLLGTVGQLRPEKSQSDLIGAVRKLVDAGINTGAIIVGSGPQRDALLAEISKLRLDDRIRLIDEVKDVRPFLKRMDVFVLSSVAVETFSNAALEAMSMGKPIVVTKVGGMEEMLCQGGGLSYEPGDQARLFELLKDILTNAEKRNELGEQARRSVVGNFSWDSMVRTYSRLLSDPA